jgi:outer membrane lipoprotein-sorting protein
VRRTRGALVLALLLPWTSALAADARSAVEAYVARLAGTNVEDLSVSQTFTLYHPDGRHPAVTGSQRLFLKLPRAQRLEQTVDDQREVRVTIGERVWVRQHDGRTFQAPPADGRRDRVHLLTAFQRSADDLLREWQTFGVRRDVSDETRVGGRRVTIIGARASERDRPAVWIDPEHGVVRFITRERLPQGEALVDVVFSDHRPLIDRFFYPYRQEVFADGRLLVLVAVRSVAVNTRLSDDLFDPDVLKRKG